jgi:peptide/nickel transport system substrate-binding protein
MTAPRLLQIALVLLLVGCATEPQNTNEGADDQNKLVYGLTLLPSGIDPHINQSAELGIVLRQVYDTLVYRHPATNEIVPGLAEAWTTSEDGLNYTFKLREDVNFHDGTPFNADAVGVNLTRIVDPETASQKARPLLGPIRSYQVIDEFTIRITLSQPFAPLLDALSQVYLGMASPAALREYNNLRYQFHQVGTGPFTFEEYVPEDRIVLRRNPDYTWGPSFYFADVPDNAVKVIEYRWFTDPATRVVSLENGDADIMGEIAPIEARTLANNESIVLDPVEIPGQPLQFYINTQRFPTDNLAVRQALLFATNRTAITDAVFQGFSPVAWGPITGETLHYNRGVVGVYDYDVEQAQSLLEAAGFRDDDEDGILERNGQPLEVTAIQPPWGFLPEVTQLLQDQLRSVGVRLIIEPMPGFSALNAAVQEGEYNLVAFNTFGFDPVFLNNAFLSNSSSNWSNHADVELDALLLDALNAQDSETRRLAYGEAQAKIMQQALILPIRDYVNLNARRARIEGLVFDPYGWFPLMHNVTLRDAGG